MLLLPPCVRATDLEKLIMPGPVSRAHEKLEADCSSCHDRADRARQTSLCLDCHEEIAADIRSATRYHGRMENARGGQCRGCHTEHLGRNADINKLSAAGFNHALANFPLDGAHTSLPCGTCHRSGKPYRRAPSGCLDCHQKNDVHRGSLGSECASCHDSSSWSDTRFDHQATDFPLTHRHLEVSCAACHPGQKYKGTPRQCAGCHQPDDVHKGSQGSQCASCHSTADWRSQRFDHTRETGFALLGRHAAIGCGDCHRSGNTKDPVPKDCAGCHRTDDRHAARFEEQCGDCHGNEDWRVPDFDHAAKARFRLEGAHAKLDCHACHTAAVADQKLGSECLDCHRADEPHGGGLGRKCAQCHEASKWSEVDFDHDQSSYPLTGLHVIVTCAECHPTKRFNDAPRDCAGCHARDDIHNGGLGKNCGDCHTPNGWKQWDFDHATHTRFPLTGTHAKVSCGDCHLRPQNAVKPSMVCGSCHSGNDVHAGRFGAECQRCHGTVSFKRPRTN